MNGGKVRDLKTSEDFYRALVQGVEQLGIEENIHVQRLAEVMQRLVDASFPLDHVTGIALVSLGARTMLGSGWAREEILQLVELFLRQDFNRPVAT